MPVSDLHTPFIHPVVPQSLVAFKGWPKSFFLPRRSQGKTWLARHRRSTIYFVERVGGLSLTRSSTISTTDTIRGACKHKTESSTLTACLYSDSLETTALAGSFTTVKAARNVSCAANRPFTVSWRRYHHGRDVALDNPPVSGLRAACVVLALAASPSGKACSMFDGRLPKPQRA